jgi:hypothetical protein
LLHLVERDGGKDRIIYRLIITSRIANDGLYVHRVDDFVDPEFLKVNRDVFGQATEARLAVERVMWGE